MQAVVAGARAASETQTQPVVVEVMVPFVSTATEVSWVRERIMTILDNAGMGRTDRIRVSFGTMIELPRACLRAGDIASMVDFISFGTNDLTQDHLRYLAGRCAGLSRPPISARAVYERDPFVTIDEKGVGEMIAIAIARGQGGQSTPQGWYLR